MLLQTKSVPPLLNVLLSRVISAFIVGSTNAAAAHEATQGTTRDKNKILHALDAQSMLLCPGEPDDHIVLDVFLEYSRRYRIL